METNLTRREQFAMAAMQGLCAGYMEGDESALAKAAVSLADATMKALEPVRKVHEQPAEPVNDANGH